MKKNVFSLFLSLAVFVMFAATAQAGDVRISVAASMTDLFKTLIVSFNQQHPDINIVTNFASSGSLAKQIENGAPAEVYVSANPKWMDYLMEKGKIDNDTKKIFAYNSLVFVGMPTTKVSSLEDLKGLKMIGIGSPESVPAGKYAKQALTKAGVWDSLEKSNKLAKTKDVRQALIYADRGETDGSFVYKTDAMLATQAKILYEVPQDLYSRVTYPVAVTAAGSANAEAKTFYDYVTSDAAHEAMVKFGFILPE